MSCPKTSYDDEDSYSENTCIVAVALLYTSTPTTINGTTRADHHRYLCNSEEFLGIKSQLLYSSRTYREFDVLDL